MAKNLDGKEFKFPKWYQPNNAFANIAEFALIEIKALRKKRKLGVPNEITTIKEWNNILDNIIFYLEVITDKRDDKKFYKGKYKTKFIPLENGMSELVFLEKPKLINKKGLTLYNKRVELGKKQFFKYFENLWD